MKTLEKSQKRVIINMQRTIRGENMSFDFGNINPQIKAQAAYKDASGMGGGGMYFKQKGKRKDQPDDDLFERKEDEVENEITFDSEPQDIPQDTMFNKFVNWFRQGQ